MASCCLEVEEIGVEARAGDGFLAGDEYFTALMKSLDLDCARRFIEELPMNAMDTDKPWSDPEELPMNAMGTDKPWSDSASDWCEELANPLDVVYEAVAELSCHCSASESRGWVDVDLVTAAACEALSCDMAVAAHIVREAIDHWCMLAVMELRRSVVRFVVPFSLRDGSVVQPVAQDRGGRDETGGGDDLPDEDKYDIKHWAALPPAPGAGVSPWPPAARNAPCEVQGHLWPK